MRKIGPPFIYNPETKQWEQVGTTDIHRVQRSEEEPVDPNVEIWIRVITKEDGTTYDVVMLKDGNKKWYAPNDKNLNGVPDRAEVAANSEKLGEQLPEYYATAESVTHIVNGTTVVGKATKDGNGNNIENTYATKEALSTTNTNVTNIANGTTTVGRATNADSAATCTGNAATATKAAQLTTARTINGTLFNGAANINTKYSYNLAFGSTGTSQNYQIFARTSSTNTSGNCGATLLVSAGGQYGGVQTGLWAVEISNRGSVPTMRVNTLISASTGPTFGYYTDTTNGYFYFGILGPTYTAGLTITVLRNADVTIQNHYNSSTTPNGWTTVSAFSNVYTSGSQTISGAKTFSGATKITNTTAASSTTTGALIVSGGAGIAGNLYAANVYGAVWNDYAEFRNQIEEIKPGYCVASADNGQVYKTTEKFQACDGIVSDTFGFAIGETDECKTPLAVAGRVLAYCEGDRNDYHSGDTVCAGPDGKVCKMTREEIREWPDRIVGIVSEIPQYETWGTGNVEVDNRIWIKIK